MSSNETAATIHEFWFGAHSEDAVVVQQRSSLWWSKNAVEDRKMEDRFGKCVEAAARHERDEWAEWPIGLLALILLTDQFPRNIYRGTPKAFAFDTLAQNWCLQGLARGMDQDLRRIERVFFYLPLEHSESLAHQEQCVALLDNLVKGTPPDQRALYEGYLDFAIRHRDIIARFGRFPHRNEILGRTSTSEERAFLSQPGSSF